MTNLIRVPAPYLHRERRSDWVYFETSEMRKYKYAYETPDGRWRIERAYGACGGGWNVTDTTGQHDGGPAWWGGTYECLATLPTLTAAKAFVSEWAL